MKHLLKRTLAYFIDCLLAFTAVMLILQGLILTPIRESFGITIEWFNSGLNTELYVLATISLPVWVYFIYTDSQKSKGSFGKRLMNLSVRNSIDNERVTIGTSFKRTFLKLLPWEISHIGVVLPTPLWYVEKFEYRVFLLFGILVLVSYIISVLLNTDGKSIYDRLIGTKVVENAKKIQVSKNQSHK